MSLYPIPIVGIGLNNPIFVRTNFVSKIKFNNDGNIG